MQFLSKGNAVRIDDNIIITAPDLPVFVVFDRI